MREPKTLINAIETILDPSREIHMDKDGNFGNAYRARKVAEFITKYVNLVIGEDEKLIASHHEDYATAYDNGHRNERNNLRAEQRQRAKTNSEYPHTFGCEKFDNGKCNCGYESDKHV